MGTGMRKRFSRAKSDSIAAPIPNEDMDTQTENEKSEKIDQNEDYISEDEEDFLLKATRKQKPIEDWSKEHSAF
jgi:hypothetical protein